MPHKSITQILRTVPYFAQLDDATLGHLARMTLEQAFEAGKIVFLEGEDCAGLYVVRHGWLKAFKLSAAGREQTLHFIGPGQTFSEISALSATPRNPASVMALAASSVLLVPRALLLQLLDENPALARLIIHNLVGRIQHLVGLVGELSLHSVETRLARVLLENAAGGKLLRQRWATQSEIAARLGTVPDVLSRVLRNLAEEGLIEISRREITILDFERLQQKALLDE